jgi:hypothetical protein
VSRTHQYLDGHCKYCGVDWPCEIASSTATVFDAYRIATVDDAPRVWWPASPNGPVGRVWTLPLTLWQNLRADLDTALDSQTNAWDLPRTTSARRRAVAETAFDVANGTEVSALALALIRIGPEDDPTGAGAWVMPDHELPPVRRAIGWLRGLRRAWDSGAPVAHDPARLPLVGDPPARRRLTAPVWTPPPVTG